MEIKTAHNSSYKKLAGSVLRMNIYGVNPPLRQAAKR
jgi:hypothetical protein